MSSKKKLSKTKTHLDRNGKYRNFCIELYPDNEQHQGIISDLKSFDSEYKAVGILHDKDVYESGEKQGQLKKPHYHFVLRFPNQRYITSLAVELGMEENLIQPCESVRVSERYLLHYDNPEKYQYNKQDLVGNLIVEVLKLVNDDTEESGLKLIFDWIDQQEKVDYRKFYRWALDTPYYKLVKSNHRQIENYIAAHDNAWYRSNGYVR